MKTNKAITGASLVLVFGLMSCAQKESAKKDSFHAPPPKFIIADGRVDLKAWDQAEKKNLDLQDAIDVTEAYAARASVTARCRVNEHEHFRVSQQLPSVPIKILQVLPLELLVVDINAAPVSCAFEVTVSNGVGSRHIFNLGSAVIHDSPNDNAPLGLSGKERYWRVQNLGDLKIRKRASHLGRDIHVICESGRTRAMAIDSVINMADFDFTKMELNSGLEENAFQVQPLQQCRGVILRGEIAEAITPLFELHFPDQPLQLTTAVQRFRTTPGAYAEHQAAISSAPLPLDDYQLTNPGASRRILEIPKTPITVQVIATPADQTKLPVGAVVRPWLKVGLVPTPDAAIIEQDDRWRVELKAGGTIHLTTTFQAGAPIRCNMGGIAIEFIQPLNIIERSDRGREISRAQVDFGSRAMVALHTNLETLRTVTNPPNGICGW